ncbi:MAG TPA: type II toxin-antitoxin system RelE/ParE family toxin [Thermoanaerobaculia bacterium]|nr:type II toxin-antitoxin system RelE/ParE family toxin [Thermoanaerobaculia bacterium]
MSSFGARPEYQIVLTDSARDFYEAADAPLQRRLDRCFEILRTAPHHHPNIKPLKGRFSGSYRFRSGDYRIVYRIDREGRVVIVLVIDHRSDVYG